MLFRSDARWDLDDAAYVRYYRIPIRSLPHARSPELTVTPAAPSTVVDVVVTDGSSATGWAGAYVNPGGGSTPITPAVVSGAVRVTGSSSSPAGTLQADYTLPSIPAETPYLRVDARSFRSQSSSAQYFFKVNGTWVYAAPAARVSANPSTDLYTATSYYRIPAGATDVRVTSQITGLKVSPYVEVDQIRRLSQLPVSVTDRQKLASLYPGGSAPAQGSLHVSHPSTALGKTIVHTYPLGRPSPALMQYWLSGAATPTPDTAAINGQRIPFGTTTCELLVPEIGRAHV